MKVNKCQLTDSPGVITELVEYIQTKTFLRVEAKLVLTSQLSSHICIAIHLIVSGSRHKRAHSTCFDKKEEAPWLYNTISCNAVC